MAKEQIDNTVVDYRRCFSTDVGQRVLGNILVEAHFFEYTTTPEEQAVENFVKTILTKTGLYSIKNIDEYMQKLFTLRMET